MLSLSVLLVEDLLSLTVLLVKDLLSLTVLLVEDLLSLTVLLVEDLLSLSVPTKSTAVIYFAEKLKEILQKFLTFFGKW